MYIYIIILYIYYYIYISMDVFWNGWYHNSSIYRLIFHCKPTFLGIPHLWKPPYIYYIYTYTKIEWFIILAILGYTILLDTPKHHTKWVLHPTSKCPLYIPMMFHSSTINYKVSPPQLCLLVYKSFELPSGKLT